MNNKLTLKAIIIGTIYLSLFAAYWFLYVLPRSLFVQDKAPQIMALVVIYILFLLFTISKKLRDFFGHYIDKLTIETVVLFMVSLLLSGPLLVYLGLSSQSNDNILPSSLKFNIIELTGVLGGLVLTAATITKSHPLIAVSRYFILSTISFVLFVIFAYNAKIPVTDHTLDFYKNISTWIYLLLFFAGSVSFFMGIIRLIIVLFRFQRQI